MRLQWISGPPLQPLSENGVVLKSKCHVWCSRALKASCWKCRSQKFISNQAINSQNIQDYTTCTCSIWNSHSVIPGYKSGENLRTDKSGAGLYDSVIIGDPILCRGSSELEGTSRSKLK